MTDTYADQESRMQEAIDAYHDGQFRSAAAAARHFNLKPRRVQYRLQGMSSRSTRQPTHTRLSTVQEASLCDYIDRLDYIEHSIRLKHIRGAAEFIMNTALSPGHSPKPLGKDWVTNFIKRHPKYHKRKQKPLSAERKNAHDVESVRKAYERFQTGVQERGILREDTWNMDETGFRIGCGIVHAVVTVDKSKPLRFVDPDNRDYVTSVECISAGGWSIPPFMILKAAHILHKWGKNDLPPETILAVSSTGYSNDQLAYDWLEHFDRYSSRTQLGVWRVLILDGFGSHFTYEFWRYAEEKKIALFVLPPHSTHLTQPLDVGCFQPFKHYHSEAVDNAVRLGNSDFDRLDFLAAFNWMRNQTFTTRTIQSAFRKTGFWPYDPEIVLQKIRSLQPRPTTPEPAPVLLTNTPHTAQDLIKFGQYFERLLDEQRYIIPLMFRRPLAKFTKGSIANGFSRHIAERDLEMLHNEALTKRARKTIAGTVAQKGGWMSVDQIRKSLTMVEETAIEKAEKALKRATRMQEIQQEKANKIVKSRLRQLDYSVWKLVHAHKDVFVNNLAVGRDICRLNRDM